MKLTNSHKRNADYSENTN